MPVSSSDYVGLFCRQRIADFSQPSSLRLILAARIRAIQINVFKAAPPLPHRIWRINLVQCYGDLTSPGWARLGDSQGKPRQVNSEVSPIVSSRAYSQDKDHPQAVECEAFDPV